MAEARNYYLLYSSESAETAAVGDSGSTSAFDIDLLIETVKFFLFFDRNTIVVKGGEILPVEGWFNSKGYFAI